MDIFSRVFREMFREFVIVLDWALRNWAITATILILMIYRTGKRRHLNRHSH